MFDLSPEKLLVLGVLALVVLGPERLPKLARRAGEIMVQVRRTSGSFQQELRDAMAEPRQVLNDAVGELGLPQVPRVPSVRRAVTDTLTGAFDAGSRPVPPPSAAPLGAVDGGMPPVPDDPTLN